jgi:hypothetical protein
MLTNKCTKAKTYLKFPSEDRSKSKQEPMERKQPPLNKHPLKERKKNRQPKRKKRNPELKRSYGTANNADM